MNWKVWLHSLVAAAVGGAASSLAAVYVAPTVFNFSHDGLVKIGQLAAAGAFVAVVALLKKSPVPTLDDKDKQ